VEPQARGYRNGVSLVLGGGGGGGMKHRVHHIGLVGGFLHRDEMVTKYQKGRIGSNFNFRLHLRVVLFGSWLNLKTYFKMYSSHRTNIMEKCTEDQVLYTSRHNKVGLRIF
jgi:hypothetical protein